MPKETVPILIVVTVLLWTLPWKGIALWKAARSKDRIWFVVLFLVNTLSVLEILYIFIFSKKKNAAERQALSQPPRKIV